MAHSQKDTGSGSRGVFAAGGGALLVVACCALGPALIAGGVLGVAGGVLRSPALVALTALIVIGAVWLTMHRRTRARRPGASTPTPGQEDAGDCCSSQPADHRESRPAHDPTSHSREP